jgi:hypothetical protein
MSAQRHADHTALAQALRARVIDGPGESDRALRQAAAERAAGGPAMAEPYDALARDIGEAAYRVTDAQISSVLQAAGSEKAAFEIIAASAAGAALLRWRQAIKALSEAKDATAGNRPRR